MAFGSQGLYGVSDGNVGGFQIVGINGEVTLFRSGYTTGFVGCSEVGNAICPEQSFRSATARRLISRGKISRKCTMSLNEEVQNKDLVKSEYKGPLQVCLANHRITSQESLLSDTPGSKTVGEK